MIVLKVVAVIVFLVVLFSMVIEWVDVEIRLKELDERILQLEKRISEYKINVSKEISYLDIGDIKLCNMIREIENRIQKLERKKKSDKE